MNGIIRRVDDLGRVVIPKEMRKAMGINEADALTLFLDSSNKTLTISRYEVKCVFCNEPIDINTNDTNLCDNCRNVLKENKKAQIEV